MAAQINKRQATALKIISLKKDINNDDHGVVVVVVFGCEQRNQNGLNYIRYTSLNNPAKSVVKTKLSNTGVSYDRYKAFGPDEETTLVVLSANPLVTLIQPDPASFPASVPTSVSALLQRIPAISPPLQQQLLPDLSGIPQIPMIAPAQPQLLPGLAPIAPMQRAPLQPLLNLNNILQPIIQNAQPPQPVQWDGHSWRAVTMQNVFDFSTEVLRHCESAGKRLGATSLSKKLNVKTSTCDKFLKYLKAIVEKNLKWSAIDKSKSVQKFATDTLGFGKYSSLFTDKNNRYTDLTLAQLKRIHN